MLFNFENMVGVAISLSVILPRSYCLINLSEKSSINELVFGNRLFLKPEQFYSFEIESRMFPKIFYRTLQSKIVFTTIAQNFELK